jgi:hypothetical protein
MKSRNKLIFGCLILLFVFLGCQSVQTVQSVAVEKKRTEVAIDLINRSNMPETVKEIVRNELRSKDAIIENQVHVISQNQKKVESAETQVEKAKEETKGFAIEAGYGRVLKWIIGLGIAGVILFIAFKIAKRFAWL